MNNCVPYTSFGKTRLVPLITYTDGVKDEPPRRDYQSTLWIERAEDWYALHQLQSPVLIVQREDFKKGLPQ